MIWPDTILPGGEMSRSIEWAVTLLPQPLSSTKLSVDLRGMLRLTPSTACTVSSSRKKYVRRSRTLSKLLAVSGSSRRGATSLRRVLRLVGLTLLSDVPLTAHTDRLRPAARLRGS